MRVRFVASDPYGGGNLRSVWPSEALKDRGIEAVSNLWYPRADEYDVFVVHRPLDQTNVRFIEDVHAAGGKVIVDEDDDLYQLDQTKNEAAKRILGADGAYWHSAALAAADAVTVSTPALATSFAHLNENIQVAYNHLPSWVCELPRPRMNNQYVQIGYAGIIQTHLHDLEWLAIAGEAMMVDAEFTWVGDIEVPRALRTITWASKHYEFQATAPLLYGCMARADIGIVPLLPCPFNEAKSWLKALEYMSLGIPVVATNLPEQSRLIEHGVTGFLADTPGEFAEYVQILVHDEAMRLTMGMAARDKARTLTIDKHVDEWVAAVEHVAVRSAV
jgi:glycosyltransferase involved in cell wall biosynthesis